MDATQSDQILDAWSHARDKFCEDLTPDEAVLFSTATLETVVEEAKLPVTKHQPGKLVHGIESVAAAIEQYGDALDVISSTYSLIMGPLWGSLRVVLHLAREYGDFFEKLLKMFTRIGDVLPRFQTYEKLFPNNDRLRNNLSNAYLDILHFCNSAKLIFKNRRPSTLHLKLVFRSSWKPFKTEFGGIIEKFRQHQKTIEREAGLSHMLEADNERKFEKEARDFLQKRQKDQDRTRLLTMLSDVPWNAFHRRQQRLRHHGTGGWLQETSEFKSWISDVKSSRLSCCGIPGAGKTILCSSTVDYIRNMCTKPTVAYHYFDYLDPKTMSITSVLGSIIQQILLSRTDIPGPVEKVLTDIYIHGLTTPAAEELTEALRLTLETSPDPTLPSYILIDGLDECDREVQDDLLLAINSLVDLDTTVIKLFFFFRNDERFFSKLKGFPCVKLLEAQLSGDIVAYVEDTVRCKIEDGSLVIRNPQLETEIVNELISKACGMFLWVHLQLEEICDNTQSDSSIRETLRDLPIGLEATYMRIQKKIEVQPNRQKEIAQKILEWVVCAKRALTMPELKEAIFFDSTQKAWDGTRIPDDKKDRSLIQTCHNLVTFDDYDETVRPAHHTVETFLISPSDTVSEASPLFLLKARRSINDMCAAYLMFSDFEVQVTRPASTLSLAPLENFASASVSQTSNALGIPHSLSLPFQALKGLRGRHMRPDTDYGKFVQVRRATQAQPPFSDKYRLLDYVVKNWAAHLSDLAMEGSDVDWRFLRYLALDKKAPFSFRPWDWIDLSPGEPDSLLDIPHIRLFDWVIENGHFPLLPLLYKNSERASLTSYITHAKSRSGFKDRMERIAPIIMETLLSALRNDNIQVCEHILEILPTHIPIDSSCITWALENENPKIIEQLLEGGRHFPFGDEPMAALHCAAQGGHVEIFQLLVDNTQLGLFSKLESFRAAFLLGYKTLSYELLDRNLPSFCLEEIIGAIHIAAQENSFGLIRTLFVTSQLFPLLSQSSRVYCGERGSALERTNQNEQGENLEILLQSEPGSAYEIILEVVYLAAEYHPIIVKRFLRTPLLRTAHRKIFFDASRHGSVEVLKNVVEGHHSLTSDDILKALCVAAAAGHMSVIACVLASQLTLNFTLENTMEVLYSAGDKDRRDVARLVFGRMTTLYPKMWKTHSVLGDFLLNTGLLEIAQNLRIRRELIDLLIKSNQATRPQLRRKLGDFLLDSRIETSEQTVGRPQLLINASREGNFHLVQKLLEVDLWMARDSHKTLLEVEELFTTFEKLRALFAAAAAEQHTVVKFILQSQIIPAIIFTISDPRMIDSARENGHVQAILQIVQGNINHNAPATCEAYDWADKNGYWEIARMLHPETEKLKSRLYSIAESEDELETDPESKLEAEQEEKLEMELESKLRAKSSLEREAESRAEQETEPESELEAKSQLELEIESEEVKPDAVLESFPAWTRWKAELELKLKAESRSKAELEAKLEAGSKLNAELQSKLEAESKLKETYKSRLIAQSTLTLELDLKLEAESQLRSELELKLETASKLPLNMQLSRIKASDLDGMSRNSNHCP